MRGPTSIGTIAIVSLSFAALTVNCLGQEQAPRIQLNGLGANWAELTVWQMPGTNFALEVSEDLKDWRGHLEISTRLDSVKLYDRDVSPRSGGLRFYRVRVPGRTIAEARAAWGAHALESYTYHFQRTCFCTPWTVREADVSVRNGQVVSATNVVYMPSPDRSAQPPEQPDLSKLKTIDEWFRYLEDAQQRADTTVVSYDSVWGFPRRMVVDEFFEMVDDEDEYYLERLTPLIADAP
jgi:hypothetical protein